MIKLYNTMTRQLEPFKTQVEGIVRMYVCGPTVYNYIHIGNGRAAASFDTIRRYLLYRGYEVTYVSNFTDVDDKIIRRAREVGVTPHELAATYITAYQEDAKALNILPASYHPKVTDYIPQIIRFIEDLIAKEVAYVSQGDVYFRVSTSKNYGKLAHKNVEDLLAGASGRLDEDRNRKENPLDFALWKSVKSDDEPWSSPWGQGRPGWHIECSVMAGDLLGDTLDIHAGGADLEFPHHTNEIAQSEAKTGKAFANYWLHNGFVTVNNEKMSKSLGNFMTVHEALQTVDGMVLRFFLSSQHYRRPLQFTADSLEEAKTTVMYLKNTYHSLFNGQVDMARLIQFEHEFQAAMDEDFNAANGLTVLFEMARWINSGHYDQAGKDLFARLLSIFGLVFEEEILDKEIEDLIEQRQKARQQKDFVKADAIRDSLAKKGIRLLDTKDGVRWQRD